MNCTQCDKKVAHDDRHFITGMCWECYKVHQRRLEAMQFPEGLRMEPPKARPFVKLGDPPPMRNPSVVEKRQPSFIMLPEHPKEGWSRLITLVGFTIACAACLLIGILYGMAL